MKKTITCILLFFSVSGIFAQNAPFKTACVSWAFHGFGAGYDPTPAIDTIAKLGFDGIQLMINQEADLNGFWTDERIATVKKRLADKKLELVSLVPFFVCYPHLGSSDPANVKASIANFEKCCRIAQKMGTKQIEMLAPFVSEFIDPNRKPFNDPYFVYKIENNAYKPGQKIQLQSPDNLQWDVVWKRLLGVMGQCSKIAKKYGLVLIVEPHYNSIMPSTDGFLLFAEALKDDNLKLTADTGWGTQQVEYSPMVVHRTQKHLRVMQFRDVDNMTRNFAPMGEGVVDIAGVLRALKQINFKGYISFEEVGMPNTSANAARFLQIVKQ